MSIKFLVLGEGGYWRFLEGGGSANFLNGRADLSELRLSGKMPDAIGAMASLQTAIMSTNLIAAPHCALPQDYLGDTPIFRAMVGVSQKGSPERCRFRFFPFFFSVFFRFLPFSSVFSLFFFRFFFPFHFQKKKKKRGDTVRETPFAKPRYGGLNMTRLGAIPLPLSCAHEVRYDLRRGASERHIRVRKKGSFGKGVFSEMSIF